MLDEEFVNFIECVVGEKVRNLELYKQTFFHPSYDCKKNYQRLEFLGDAVLSLVVSHTIFFENVVMSEGYLTKKRMSLVRKEVLSSVCEKLGFKKYILLGKGEEQDEGRSKPSILADVFEAFIGAMYLEKGYDFVLRWFNKNYALFYEAGKEMKDYKSMFQEIVQQKKLGTPVYVVSKEEGEPHKKQFFIELYIGKNKIAQGFGKSKKMAEQQAAKLGCMILSDEEQ